MVCRGCPPKKTTTLLVVRKGDSPRGYSQTSKSAKPANMPANTYRLPCPPHKRGPPADGGGFPQRGAVQGVLRQSAGAHVEVPQDGGFGEGGEEGWGEHPAEGSVAPQRSSSNLCSTTVQIPPPPNNTKSFAPKFKASWLYI